MSLSDEDVNFGSDLPHLEQIKQIDKDVEELRRRRTEKRQQKKKQELENDRRREKEEEAEIRKERLDALRRAAVLPQEQLEGKMKVLQE